MKRVPMAQFGRVKGKRHIVIGTEKSGSVFGNVEKSSHRYKSDKEVVREIKRLNCGKTAK